MPHDQQSTITRCSSRDDCKNSEERSLSTRASLACRKRTTLSTESYCGKYSHASPYHPRCLQLTANSTTACGIACALMASTRDRLTSRRGGDKAACGRRCCLTFLAAVLHVALVRSSEDESIVWDLVHLEEDVVSGNEVAFARVQGRCGLSCNPRTHESSRRLRRHSPNNDSHRDCLRSSGPLLVVLSNIMNIIHRILRSSTCWIGILIEGNETSG